MPDPLSTSIYDSMIGSMRALLDKLAGTAPDDATVAALDRDIRAWTTRLDPFAADEANQPFGRLDRPGRGQSTTPPLFITASDARSLHGHVTFGRYFLGANGAAHGGTIATVFDDALGILANAESAALARTAYLKVDFRAIVPIETVIHVHVLVAKVDGRKRFLRGELRHEGRLCAEAEALFVQLREGQP